MILSQRFKELGEATQESIHAFADKVSCFIDVEFLTKSTSWFGWLYRQVWGEQEYDHKISICYTEIKSVRISDYISSILERSDDTLKDSNVVLFNTFLSKHMRFSDVINSYVWIPHNVFGHALGLKHLDGQSHSGIHYQSYMNHSYINNSAKEQELSDCVKELFKRCGIINEITPVDLKGLQNIWGSKNINENTACYRQVEAFEEKYSDFVNIVNVDI